MFKRSSLDKLLIFLPLIVGFSSIFLFSKKPNFFIKSFPKNGIFPDWVFSFVWTILYLLLGIAFYHSPYKFIYLTLMFLLFLWPIIYTRNYEKISIILFLIILMNTFYCYLFSPIISKICLIPLITWLLFALNLLIKI